MYIIGNHIIGSKGTRFGVQFEHSELCDWELVRLLFNRKRRIRPLVPLDSPDRRGVYVLTEATARFCAATVRHASGSGLL